MGANCHQAIVGSNYHQAMFEEGFWCNSIQCGGGSIPCLGSRAYTSGLMARVLLIEKRKSGFHR